MSVRGRNTMGRLGFWEHLDNPGANPIEFDGIRNLAIPNCETFTARDATFVQQALAQLPRDSQASLNSELCTKRLSSVVEAFVRPRSPGNKLTGLLKQSPFGTGSRIALLCRRTNCPTDCWTIVGVKS